MTKTNAELAEEIGRNPCRVFTADELRQIIAALRSGPERDVEPFCWWRTTRDITDEYVTVYSDDGTRPEGDGWKPLYERPPSGEMREALECAEYALSHPASDQAFALHAVRTALSAAEAEAKGRKS